MSAGWRSWGTDLGCCSAPEERAVFDAFAFEFVQAKVAMRARR